MNTQDISLGRCFSEGWEAFKNNMGMAIGATLLFGVIHIVLCYIPFLNFLYMILAMYPFIGGFYVLLLGIVKGLNPEIGTLFSGFGGGQWARWMGVGWLMVLYILVVEIVCAVIPGLLVLIAYYAFGEGSAAFITVAVIAGLAFYIAMIAITMRWAFVFLLAAEGMTATQAIRTSAEWTQGIRWKLFWILFVIALLGYAGAIACGIGLAFTGPLAACCMAALYLDVKQMRTPQPPAPAPPTPEPPPVQ